MSPNQPKTPTTTFRLPPDVREALREAAERQGITQTDITVAALRKHLRLAAPKR